MYYDNKSSFYLKQYGLPILAIVISLIIIGAGSYIYWLSSTTNAPKQNVVTASNELQDVDENTIAILGKTLANLKPMQTSDVGTITDISDDGSIIFKFNELAIKLNLIGVDTTSITTNYIETLKKDLVGKEAKIAFDNVKIENSNVYAYVYVDNILYNQSILENGLAKLKDESKNVTLQNELKQAQAYAKQLSKGVWKK